MKKLNIIGKIVFAIGVLSIFRKVDGFYGFGGYVDNTWEIIIISILICLTGITIIYLSKRNTSNKKK
jgi:hypothetical protein